MICKKCGGVSKVLETRNANHPKIPDYIKQLDPGSVFRRRVCNGCNFQAITIEVEIKCLESSVTNSRNIALEATIKKLEAMIER